MTPQNMPKSHSSGKPSSENLEPEEWDFGMFCSVMGLSPYINYRERWLSSCRGCGREFFWKGCGFGNGNFCGLVRFLGRWLGVG